MKEKEKVIIIGAGPAGLTAAWELLQRTDYLPIVLEASNQVGGLSKTVVHGNKRMDLGGHRFFSKSSEVLQFWFSFLPPDPNFPQDQIKLTYHNQTTSVKVRHQPAVAADEIFQVRPRKSRIFYRGKLFDYPLKINLKTLLDFGFWHSVSIMVSYIWSNLFPVKPEKTLEDFFINRFGRKLYQSFFKSYTEKVWGVKCDKLSAEWGAQRIKDLSIRKAIGHFISSFFRPKKKYDRSVNSSLTEFFLYPPKGPGQLWEKVASEIEKAGGEIMLNAEAVQLQTEANEVKSLKFLRKGKKSLLEGKYFLSTMPIAALFNALEPAPPAEVLGIATQLPYRHLMVVGVELDHLALGNISDNWLYIQDPGVELGRVQLFHNWSDGLVPDKETIWLGLEYFCNEEDPIWNKKDEEIIAQAGKEMEQIRLAKQGSIKDAIVVRVPHSYPAYHGAYQHFDTVKEWLNGLSNFFPIGRNGMHRYNNQDHSMLTAMRAVDLISQNSTDKSILWEVNTEQEYHEG